MNFKYINLIVIASKQLYFVIQILVLLLRRLSNYIFLLLDKCPNLLNHAIHKLVLSSQIQINLSTMAAARRSFLSVHPPRVLVSYDLLCPPYLLKTSHRALLLDVKHKNISICNFLYYHYLIIYM